MKNFLLIGGATTLLMAGCGASNQADKHPNIIYFLLDDMGIGDLSLYGQSNFDTPNIDRLASEGMRFSHHYSGSTVSGPSRACLMTGKHTGHNSVRGNNPKGQLLGDDEATLASVLKEAGYRTATIGKWGIGSPIPLDDPAKKGFDYFYGYLDMYHAHNCFPEFLYRNGEKVMLEGNKTQLDADGNYPWGADTGAGVARLDSRKQYAPYLFEQEALQFIEESSDSPFFLYYALNLPHANNEAKDNGCEVPSYGEFADRDYPDTEKGFAQMMRILDNQLGALLDKLEQMGIADNTIVMLASDNGAHQEGGHQVEFFDSNSYLRGHKRDLHEGGIKTPFIVRWPARVEAGSESSLLSAFWDILPTFCDIAGQSVPEGIDGLSLLPTLVGEDERQQLHDHFYFEFNALGRIATVNKKWKYIEDNLLRKNGDQIEYSLYDLEADPSEEVNVIDKYPEVAKQMSRYIDEDHTDHPFIPAMQR